MNKNELFKLGKFYLMFNLIFLTYFILFNVYLYGIMDFRLDYNSGGFADLLVIIELLTFPFGFIFTFYSIISLFLLKIRRTNIFGIVGNTLYCLSIIVFTTMYFYDRDIQLLLLILFWIGLIITNLISLLKIRFERENINMNDESVIRKTILDLGTKFMRLEVREISEKCGFDRDSIIGVLKKMIFNKEIYADFFKSTNTVSFDQQTNIDEIDRLMTVYKDWEKEHYEKET